MTDYRYLAERGAEIRTVARAADTPGTADAPEDRVVDVVWSTGAGVYRAATPRHPAHIEELDLVGCRLDRLNAGAPLLAVHRQDSLEAVLGSVVPGTARIEDGVARATVRFSRRPDVDPIWQDVRDGHLRACSVAYRVERVERIQAQRAGEPEIWRVVDWTPIEVSVVPVGADPGARIRAFFDEPPTEESKAMTFPDQTTEHPRADPPAPAPAPAPDPAEAIRAAVEAERARVAEITALGTRFGLPPDAVSDLIRRGATVDQARAQVLETLAARTAAAPVYPTVTTPVGGLDEHETMRRGIEDAIAYRALPDVHKVTEPAKPYVNMTLLEMARAFLTARGEDVRTMSRLEIARRAATTSDFPLILANVATASLREGYGSVDNSWQRFCSRQTALDLKDIYPTFFGEAPMLVRVEEGQEIPRGPIVEARDSYRLAKYAVEFAVTDEVLINDRLDALGRLPRGFGVATAQLEASMVFGLLGSNPTMYDGQPLFHASHKNLASTGAVLSVSSFAEARTAMRKQRGLGGTIVADIRPEYLIVPAEIEVVAEQLTTPTTPAQASQVTPPTIQRMTVISSPYLSDYSTTAWYVAASPAVVPMIEYARLQGTEEVQITTYRDNQRMANVVQAVHYFAAKAVDWRGFFKNPGA